LVRVSNARLGTDGDVNNKSKQINFGWEWVWTLVQSAPTITYACCHHRKWYERQRIRDSRSSSLNNTVAIKQSYTKRTRWSSTKWTTQQKEARNNSNRTETTNQPSP
jgi:hypothetical protein